MQQKKVALINDLACFGKCSLMVNIPVLSSMGIAVSPIITTLLSSHTGGYNNIHKAELTAHILPIAKALSEEKIKFDGIVTGYFSNRRQIEETKKALELLNSRKTLLVVDPCFADKGKLYAGLDEDIIEGFKQLCAEADFIIPNVTEAAFLTDSKYLKGIHKSEYILKLAQKLSKLTDAKIIITGVRISENKIGCALFDGKKIKIVATKKIPNSYHGAGDVFTSAFTALLIKGKKPLEAVKKAQHLTALCIKKTYKKNAPEKQGLLFEEIF